MLEVNNSGVCSPLAQIWFITTEEGVCIAGNRDLALQFLSCWVKRVRTTCCTAIVKSRIVKKSGAVPPHPPYSHL